MWSYRVNHLFRMAVILFALAVAGCGFRPIHGTGGQGPSYQALSSVHISPVEDRVGQILYNRLLDRMNSTGRPKEPRFRLETTLSEAIERVGFQKNEFATRANLRLRAQYTLFSQSTGTPVLTNNETVVASYNILRSDFATLASENEARRRAARVLADEIVNRLSLYFAASPVAASANNPP